MQDIRYWCEEGLIVADRSLVFSKSRERCWKKAEGESRSGGGEGGESLGVDWHGGKLSPTSGSEQPCLSILLSHDRKRHESETHSWSGGAVFVYRTRTSASHYAPYIYIFKYILWRCALCLSLLQPSCRFSLHSRVVFFVLHSSSLSRCLSVSPFLSSWLCFDTHFTAVTSHLPRLSASTNRQHCFDLLNRGEQVLIPRVTKISASVIVCSWMTDLRMFFFFLLSFQTTETNGGKYLFWGECFKKKLPFIKMVWTKECIYIIMNRRLKHFTDSLRPVHSIKLGLWGIISFIHFFIYVSLCLVHVFMSRHKKTLGQGWKR